MSSIKSHVGWSTNTSIMVDALLVSRVERMLHAVVMQSSTEIRATLLYDSIQYIMYIVLIYMH